MNSIIKRKISSLSLKIRRHFLYWFWKIRPITPPKNAHHLPHELIVSLTSYPPRFATLAPVLKTLLSQSVKPDATILWIAHKDFALLPKNVLELQQNGLLIKQCPDLRSYKKIIPALKNFPNAFIVTADDDILYEYSWLNILIKSYKNNQEVLFRRGHTVTLNQNLHPRPYGEWVWEKTSSENSSLNFPTGGAGALYPPKVFDTRVADSEYFLRLAPTADDLWLFWMAGMGGAQFRRVGPEKYRMVIVNQSQSGTLGEINNGPEDQNTQQLNSLFAEFGMPWV